MEAERVESSSVLLKIVHRQEHNVENLLLLLEDPRARLLATRLTALNHQIYIIENLLDPPLDVQTKPVLNEKQVATLNKWHLTKIHTQLAEATSKLAVSLTNIMDTTFDVDPVVETETDLSANLGKVYRTVIGYVEKINSALSDIESTTFPDEVLKATASLRNLWTDLRLLLRNQITEPLKAALMELARETALKQIAQTVYGGQTVG
jgi:hypothetical protein